MGTLLSRISELLKKKGSAPAEVNSANRAPSEFQIRFKQGTLVLVAAMNARVVAEGIELQKRLADPDARQANR